MKHLKRFENYNDIVADMREQGLPVENGNSGVYERPRKIAIEGTNTKPLVAEFEEDVIVKPKLTASEKTEEFLKWFSMKSGIKIGKRLGQGEYGIVYEIDNYRVIKITDNIVYNQYSLLNKNVEGIIRIYQAGLIKVPKRFTSFIIDKEDNGSCIYLSNRLRLDLDESMSIGYIVMERLNVNDECEIRVNDLEKLLKIFSDRYKSEFRYNHMISNYFSFFNRMIKTNPVKTKGFLDDFISNMMDYKGLFSNFYNTIKDVMILYKALLYIAGIMDYEDIHKDQFGLNNKGELKLYDIGENDLDFEDEHFDLVKNVIKEEKLK